MPKQHIAILLVILFLFFGCASRADDKTVSFLESGVVVNAQIADTAQERANGLMERIFLYEKEGMLFMYDDEEYRVFWMYRTKIPLDVIFISSDWQVVDFQSMEPCEWGEAGKCQRYISDMPAKYALEVNLGFVRKHGIKMGEKVKIG